MITEAFFRLLFFEMAVFLLIISEIHLIIFYRITILRRVDCVSRVFYRIPIMPRCFKSKVDYVTLIVPDRNSGGSLICLIRYLGNSLF